MPRTTRSEAARQLGVNRSTVCRWCKENPALLDGSGQVDVEELRQFEQTVKHPGNQTKARPGPSGDETPPMQPAKDPGAPSINSHRARTEQAKATSAELDLAERMQLTLRRDEVQRAVAEAGDLIRQKASQLARDRAERLALIEDVRAMETALDEMMRDLLATAATALGEAARDGKDEDADAA